MINNIHVDTHKCNLKPVNNMINIGNIKVNNVILAPMCGVTDYPFRKLVSKLGGDLMFSEMIASRAVLCKLSENLKKTRISEYEKRMSVQLAGYEPDTISQAAKIYEDHGAKIIDINFGCPVKKVVNGYAGSALMKDEPIAFSILESVVKSVKIPVTLKMRMGWDNTNLNAPTIAKFAEEVGIKMITVHCRTRSQMYNGKANWEFIQKIKDVVTIPVIVNGDIKTFEDLTNALNVSNADGVMIGRGAYGRPWILKNFSHFIKTGKKLNDPNINEKYEIILEHYDEILSFYGEDCGNKMARKHISWYSSNIPNSAEFRKAFNIQNNSKIAKKLIQDFFEPLLF